MRNSQGNAPIDGEPLAAAPLYVVGWTLVVLSTCGLGWLLLATANGFGSETARADWLCGAGGLFAGFLLIGVGALLTEMRAVRRLLYVNSADKALLAAQAVRPRANADEEWKKP